jgi:hypothetical protein
MGPLMKRLRTNFGLIVPQNPPSGILVMPSESKRLDNPYGIP